ncbi:acyl-coa-binding domain-containing protein [Anaeramoeba flamelloides]|uniref:Acyl-coa-binding domain-containing protein n=1 Tax=Anaeramoeba flamelloides TaxID=1746091 RepID=A0ABQ8XZ24_9EUKA|nr:acyl-coa-binding domain-containing protein [Anaeramoeba flamelloides]
MDKDFQKILTQFEERYSLVNDLVLRLRMSKHSLRCFLNSNHTINENISEFFDSSSLLNNYCLLKFQNSKIIKQKMKELSTTLDQVLNRIEEYRRIFLILKNRIRRNNLLLQGLSHLNFEEESSNDHRNKYNQFKMSLQNDLSCFLEKRHDYLLELFSFVLNCEIELFSLINKQQKQEKQLFEETEQLLQEKHFSTLNKSNLIADKKITLNQLLGNVYGVKYFRQFLDLSFAGELLDFYLQVEQFKIVDDLEKQKIMAKQIWRKFYFEDSQEEIDFPQNYIECVQKALTKENDLNINIFNDSQSFVLKLMNENYFPQFIKSKTFEYLKFRLIPESDKLEQIILEANSLDSTQSNDDDFFLEDIQNVGDIDQELLLNENLSEMQTKQDLLFQKKVGSDLEFGETELTTEGLNFDSDSEMELALVSSTSSIIEPRLVSNEMQLQMGLLVRANSPTQSVEFSSLTNTNNNSIQRKILNKGINKNSILKMMNEKINTGTGNVTDTETETETENEKEKEKKKEKERENENEKESESSKENENVNGNGKKKKEMDFVEKLIDNQKNQSTNKKNIQNKSTSNYLDLLKNDLEKTSLQDGLILKSDSLPWIQILGEKKQFNKYLLADRKKRKERFLSLTDQQIKKDLTKKSLELYSAVRSGDRLLVQELLKKNISELNVNFVNFNDHAKTPLFASLYDDHFELTILLLNNGARSDVRDENLQTPLHLAIELDAIKCFQILIAFGANTHIRDKNGNRPIDIANKNLARKFEFLKILLM